MKAWECSRCGISPEDGDELHGSWLARAFLKYEIESTEGGARVIFHPSDLLGLTCPGCKTGHDRGVLKTLPTLGRELLTRLQPQPL